MTDTPESIISNRKILNTHIGDFGPRDKRSVVNEALLKIACGYHIGSTAKKILIKHQLIHYNYNTLTIKGRNYLWSVFGVDFL